MNAEWINPLVSATLSVFESVLGCRLTRKPLFVKSSATTEMDVSGVIGLSGPVKGNIVLGLPLEAALNAAEAMLGQRPPAFDADTTNVVTRIMEMIVPAKDGMIVGVGNVVTGPGHQIDFPSHVIPICVPFDSDWGRLTLELGLVDGLIDSDCHQQAGKILTSVHDLTASVARDVGEHTTRVREISSELQVRDEIIQQAVVLSVADKLLKANEKMEWRLAIAEAKLQEQAKLIESHAVEARTDSLTSLANRRAFDDEMVHCISQFRQEGAPFTVMMLDVDHFKRFNDSHGHQAGDEALRGVAHGVQSALRNGDMAARYGGEEFAVIFSSTSLAQAKATAEQARKAISRERFRNRRPDAARDGQRRFSGKPGRRHRVHDHWPGRRSVVRLKRSGPQLLALARWPTDSHTAALRRRTCIGIDEQPLYIGRIWP